VNAAESLSPEELTKDFGTADHSVLGTLVHVYAADRVWYARVHGYPPARFIEPDVATYLERVASLRFEDPLVTVGIAHRGIAGPKVSYKDLKGNPYETPLRVIALHLVNHATHHRARCPDSYEPWAMFRRRSI
jgi:uncharacterized damage-inducible protein DinB